MHEHRSVVEVHSSYTQALRAEESSSETSSSNVANNGNECPLKPDSCKNVIPKQRVELRGTKYWVMYNLVLGEQLFACDESVTYTTHGDFTFFDHLSTLAEKWNGPISFAVYAPSGDFRPTIKSIIYLRQCAPAKVKRLVTFHLFFDVDHIPGSLADDLKMLNTLSYDCQIEQPPWHTFKSVKTTRKIVYPINVARNVARQTVMTHFVLASDVELFPSVGFIPAFLSMVSSLESSVYCRQPAVFVLSIFEVAETVRLPENKSQLQSMLKNSSAIPFHARMCSRCHTVPEAKSWRKAAPGGPLAVFHEARRHWPHHLWEPIYVGTNLEPLYDERLTWNGKMDKMSQGYIMCRKDYRFLILNNAFLVHAAGIKTYNLGRDAWRDSLAAKQRKFVLNQVKTEIDKMFPSQIKACRL